MAKVKKGYGIMTMKIRGQFPTNVTSIVFQKHYCEFHYSDYAQTNPDEVVKSFYTLSVLVFIFLWKSILERRNLRMSLFFPCYLH